jgi:tetratricopeptide (TPR) repeat protein
MNPCELWDFHDAEGSLQRLRQCASDATTDLDRALALTQVARASGLLEDFAEARAVLAEADRLLPAGGSGRAQYWLELGRIEHDAQNPAAALSCFQQSMALARDARDEYLMVDAAHMIAVVVPTDKQPQSAEFALSLARKASETRARRWIGSIANNLGWTYMELGEPEKAAKTFREALPFRLSQEEQTPIRLARYALGCALRSARQFNQAVQVLNEALALGGSIGFIEAELAECLYALGDKVQAKVLFQVAHDKLKTDRVFCEREPERLSRLQTMSL